MSDSGPCCDLELNPDITGIGVRAALYAQIMLGWVMSLYWPDTYVRNSRTAYMTATALLIASFIQLQTQDLSLLDGLVVSLITSMMITFAIASNPARRLASQGTSSPNANPQKLSVDSQKSRTRGFLQFCFVVFWGAWSWNLWKDPAHFGLKGDKVNCTTNQNITLSLFGREIHATDPRMRAAALSLVSIGFCIALCSMWFTLEQVMQPVIWLMERNKPDDAETPRKPTYENPVVQAVHVFLQSMTIATLIYLTVSTEKTISKNDVTKTTRDWTYGQTIALILLLQQVMDVFSTWIEKREEEEEEDNDSDSDLGFQLPTSNPKSQAVTDPNQATTNQATTDPNQAAANSDK